MYFISDLDKTLVYSKQKDFVCVERKSDGKEITFMTNKSVELMDKLMQNEDFCFVPCTLRSFEQTKRIDFTNGGNLEWMICDNGFSIYHYGEIYQDWEKETSKRFDVSLVKELFNCLNNYIECKNIPMYMLKSNRDGFISIIFHNEDESKTYQKELLRLVDLNIFKIDNQGKKIYVSPIELNKSIAVEYLKEICNMGSLIVSGDSSVDVDFTTLGDYCILPRHATFSHNDAIFTKNCGIEAGEEILNFVYNTYGSSKFSLTK